MSPPAVLVPRVFSLAICSELAVVRLVHRAAVTIEDSEEEGGLIDGATFGLVGKVRLPNTLSLVRHLLCTCF